MDYVFFVYGLCFFLLATMLHGMGRRTGDAMPWPLLAGFALLHGANEWLDLLSLALDDDPVSYTHLDVYKRQPLRSVTHARKPATRLDR